MPKFDVLAAGQEPIASYQPILQLGKGGMGTVDLSRAVGAGGFERLVVVKRLNRELTNQPEAVRRFLDEARQAALVHHANVVGIHQIGHDDKGYFLVLDYVEGASLDGLVDRMAARGERLPTPIALRVALDALSGLHAAHRAEDATGTPLGLLHRDVSLQNVLVGRDGVSRLADFGIAKSRLASVQTDQKYLVGKLLYLPPEYLWRQPVGPTLDIYSLGVTLWVALAGTDPWPEIDEAQLIAQICRDGFPRLTAAGVSVPPEVDALVARACDKDPAGRFQTAREMGDAIEALGRATGGVATHGEVADFVERLVGAEMKQRRDKIAAFVSAPLDGPVYTSSPSPESTSMEPTEIVERPATWMTDGPGPAPRGRPRASLVAGAVVALAAGGFFALRSSPSNAPPTSPVMAPAATPAEVTPPAPRPPIEPTTPAAATGATAATPRASSATTSVVTPIPSAPRASPAPRRPPARRETAAPVEAAAPRPPAAAGAAATGGVTAPEGILKANPYR